MHGFERELYPPHHKAKKALKLKQTTAPATLPVSLDTAKSFYRVIGAEQDADILRTLTAAYDKAEQITNRQLTKATYEGYLDAFASSVILPRPPLSSVTKVEYIDKDGATQVWTDYTVDDISVPAVIHFDSFPSDVRTKGVNNVIITFVCGYDSVPEAITSWMLVYGLTLFENRENLVDGVSVSSEKQGYFNHLLDSYRIIPV